MKHNIFAKPIDPSDTLRNLRTELSVSQSTLNDFFTFLLFPQKCNQIEIEPFQDI